MNNYAFWASLALLAMTVGQIPALEIQCHQLSPGTQTIVASDGSKSLTPADVRYILEETRKQTGIGEPIITKSADGTLFNPWGESKSDGQSGVPLSGFIKGENTEVTVISTDSQGEGFFDQTPVTPVGGNPGVTLGEQRSIAVLTAASIWADTFDVTVPIEVRVNFNPLFCEGGRATLGQAGAAGNTANFTGAPQSDTFYPQSLVNQFRGFDANGGNPEIVAEFNSEIDNGCFGSGWYYGLDGNSGGQPDFFTTILHEMVHGFGFSSLVNEQNGAQPTPGTFGIFDRFIFDETLEQPWTALNDSQRAQSAVNNGNVTWLGPIVNNLSSDIGPGRHPSGRPLLFTPSELQPGSSVSHWEENFNPNELMEPFLTTPVIQDYTNAFLAEIGYEGIQGLPTDPCQTPDEFEPNNSIATAEPFPLEDTISATIDSVADQDFFSFSANAGDEMIAFTSNLEGEVADTIITLFDADGTELAFNDDLGVLLESNLVFTIPDTGQYFLQVEDFSNENAVGTCYDLAISVAPGVAPTPTPAPSPSPSPQPSPTPTAVPTASPTAPPPTATPQPTPTNEPGNQPPSAPGQVISLAAVIGPASVDPEGSVVRYRYSWSSDGGDGPIVNGPTVAPLNVLYDGDPGVSLNVGETWNVVVTPIDEQGQEGTSITGRFTIGSGGIITFEGWTIQ